MNVTLVCKARCHNIEIESQITAKLLVQSADLAGPFTAESVGGGHRYAIVFVDDYLGVFGYIFLRIKVVPLG